jgi:O-succinylbenzoic acid--CoA ligase
MRSSRSAPRTGRPTRGTSNRGSGVGSVTRSLQVVPAQPDLVLRALRDALGGAGPAVLVGQGTQYSPADLPADVPKRVALVVETSGSSAKPKRVALSSDALLASAAASALAIGGDGQWLLALPLHYIAGLNVLVRSIASGTDPVVLGNESFDPLAFAELAETMDADLRFTSLVPAQLSRLLATPAAISSLQRFDRILVGGQSTPAPLIERAAELGINLTRTYGSSETSGGCVYEGVPIGNTSARIADGEIELSGAVLADGYLGDDERTATAFVADGGIRWYRTGDAGELVDGVLSVTGRLDDVIISGGIKVALGDVERVVRSIQNQTDAVVVRAGSERWGEVPVVITNQAIDLAELRAHVVGKLGVAAAPARVLVLPELPMLSSGKPDRVLLQTLAQ